MGPDKITMTSAFLNLTKADWHNGAVIVVVDSMSWTEREKPFGAPDPVDLPLAQLDLKVRF